MNEENKPKTVFIDIEFTRIGEIDSMNEKYYADITFALSWKVNYKIEKYDKDIDWNPLIYVENLFSKPEETIDYHLATQDSETFITEKHRIKTYLWERLEIQNFPLDIQELSITLISRLDCKNLRLVSRKHCLGINTVHTFVEQQKWKLFNQVDCSSRASYDNENEVSSFIIDNDFKTNLKMPKICFKCYVCRRPYYYLANAYFLIFLITTTAFGMFSIDCKLPQSRLQTTLTILLTSVSFKWVVNRSLPTVCYTTSLDEYAILCILYLCLMCGWHSIIGIFWEKPLAVSIDNWMLFVFLCLFISINMLFGYKLFKSYLIVRNFEKKMKENFPNIKTSNQLDRKL